MSRIIELKWTCGECGTKGILGRHKRCPSCGSPREKGEMQMDGLGAAADRDGDGYNDAKSVTDPELLKLARSGPDWFCSHCGSGNKGDGDRCSACGAPRYGNAEEDHPDFKGDYRKILDPWKDGYDPEMVALTWEVTEEPEDEEEDLDPEMEALVRLANETPRPVEREPFPERPRPTRRPPSGDDGVHDYFVARAAEQRRMRNIGFAALAVLIVFVAGFTIWALQTHDVEGTVTSMAWEQNTLVQTWTQTTTREWEHLTSERREVEPRNGSGERAGMEMIPGTCTSEHYDDERYACGTETESYDCSTTETYTCGETCRDNGNGFATCSPKTCTRTIPKTCTREVTKYCTRPIYKDKCTYRTQEWRTTRTLKDSGRGHDTHWPEAEPGRLDRLRYTADYTVVVAYEDGDGPETYQHKPGDTTTLGFTSIMTKSEATTSERDYLSWEEDETVTLAINNLGGIHSVTHGGLEVVAEAE